MTRRARWAEVLPEVAALGAATEADPPLAPPSPPADEPSRGRRLLRDNLVVATGTALSRITGVGRFFALYVMAESLRDAYVLANNTPNIVYELILGGILTATLVPLFTEHVVKDDGDATDAVVSVTVVALAALTVVACAVAPLLMLVYTVDPGAGVDVGALRSVGIQLSLLFAPQVFFYGVMAVGSALLNARRRFFAAAWAPVLNNVIVIAALLSVGLVTDGRPGVGQAADQLDLRLLIGLGTTAGIVAMAVSLGPALWRAGVHLRFRFDLRHPAVRRAVSLSGWTLGYVLANQVAAQTVNVLNDPGSGQVTSYAVAFMFFQLPHGLLAVSLMTTFQPDLARAYVAGAWDDFHRRMLHGLRLLVAVVVPAAVGYFVLSLLVRDIGPDAGAFQRSPLDEMLPVADALAGFAPGLIGFSVYLFVLRGFYALQDTRRPFWINGAENVVNIVAAVALLPFGLVGLTSAFSVAYLVGAVLAIAVLLRSIPKGFDLRGFLSTLARCLVAAALMAAVVAAVVRGLTAGDADRLLPAVAAAVVAGGLAYAVAAVFLGVTRDAGLAGRLPGPLRRLSPPPPRS